MNVHASSRLFLKRRWCAIRSHCIIESSRSWPRTLVVSSGEESVRSSRYLASSSRLDVPPANRRHSLAKRQDGGRQAAPRLDQKWASNRTDALLRLEDEVSAAVARHRKVLDQNSTTATATIEEDFKAIASKLRRLVYGWSKLHIHYCTEGCIIEGQTPPQRAERYLKQLEALRYAHSQLTPFLNTTDISFFDRLKTLFGSPADTNAEQTTRQKAHCLPEYSADAKMYYSVMNSFAFWHFYSVSSDPGQKKLENNVSRNDIRKSMPRIANSQEKEDEDSTTTKTKVRQKRAQDAIDHLMLMHEEMLWFYKAGNTFVKPNQKVNHLIMKLCNSAGSYRYVEIADRLLHQLVFDDYPSNDNLTKSIASNRCQADLASYHMVLRACQSAAQLDQMEGKKGAVSKATKLLLELESTKPSQRVIAKVDFVDDNQSDEKLSKIDSNIVNESYPNPFLTAKPDLTTYTLIISTLAFAGRGAVPDLCERIDDILFRMMGNNHFVDWVFGHTKGNGDNRNDQGESHNVVKSSSDTETERSSMRAERNLEPDMLLLHHVLAAYAGSNNPVYLNRAKQILQIMQERRLLTVRLEGRLPKNNNKTGGTGHDCSFSNLRFQDCESSYPNTQTYNAIISGFLLSSFSRNFVEEDAIYATNLLSDMMSHRDSFPNESIFDGLLKMWANSKSRQSGEEAEKLLSLMEAQAASTNNDNYKAPKPNWVFYLNALRCWDASALVREPGAAQRALVLLDKVEAQCSSCNISLEDDEKKRLFYDKHILLNHHLFTEVIRICSNTCLDKDIPDALRIALVVYKRMIENRVPCTFETYSSLLDCCRTLLPPDMRMDFSKAVFDAACTNGKVNRRLLLKLRAVNPQVYKEYRSHPDHSAGFSSNL